VTNQSGLMPKSIKSGGAQSLLTMMLDNQEVLRTESKLGMNLLPTQSHSDNMFDFQDDSKKKKDTKYKDQIA